MNYLVIPKCKSLKELVIKPDLEIGTSNGKNVSWLETWCELLWILPFSYLMYIFSLWSLLFVYLGKVLT